MLELSLICLVALVALVAWRLGQISAHTKPVAATTIAPVLSAPEEPAPVVAPEPTPITAPPPSSIVLLAVNGKLKARAVPRKSYRIFCDGVAWEHKTNAPDGRWIYHRTEVH